MAIFESLWATIRFMVAAINRGQDYMKASNNVALVPANGTFEFANTLSMAYRCVRSTMPTGRHLIIHPLPADLCPMLISDSHWLLENLLCLTSNAIKYSDSGDIDLIVTMEPTPTRTLTTATATVIKTIPLRVSNHLLSTAITSRSILETGVISTRRRQLSISKRISDPSSVHLIPVMCRSLLHHPLVHHLSQQSLLHILRMQ